MGQFSSINSFKISTRLILIVFLLNVLVSCLNNSKETIPKKQFREHILFVGNSLTYYNDIPSKVSALYLAETGENIEVEMIAEGGISLEQHLKGSLVAKSIEQNHYSYVVLQDFGGWPFCSANISACSKDESSLRYLISLSLNSKAIPIWYSTYQINPRVQKELSKKVNQIAYDLDVIYADVGSILQKYTFNKVGNNPFSNDGHLNQRGSWLAALLITEKILGFHLSSDLKINKVCSNDWRGMSLSADKFASKQNSKKNECVQPSTNFIKEALQLLNDS